jgi:cytochrome c oxidase cbb3-type subunit 1
MMHGFGPKMAERPVCSCRLPVIDAWSPSFLYIQAGPLHLHVTTLAEWAQSLGMVFIIMLWMRFSGGMITRRY